MPEASLEAKLDQLYAADPGDFVALRKQLQGELRAEGMKPEAELLGRARRPSTSMWAVNQLVRRRPELVDALLERSEELRTAQTRGERDALRDAIRAHRTALSGAADAAADILGPRANDAFREEILTVLRGASTQPELGRELRAGRLVRSDDITPGFPDLEGFAAAPPPARPRRAVTKERDEQAAVDQARAAERQTREQLDRARDDEASANAAAAAAQRRVDELGEQLAIARDELREARSRARKAHAESGRLVARLERASHAGRR